MYLKEWAFLEIAKHAVLDTEKYHYYIAQGLYGKSIKRLEKYGNGYFAKRPETVLTEAQFRKYVRNTALDTEAAWNVATYINECKDNAVLTEIDCRPIIYYGRRYGYSTLYKDSNGNYYKEQTLAR